MPNVYLKRGTFAPPLTREVTNRFKKSGAHWKEEIKALEMPFLIFQSQWISESVDFCEAWECKQNDWVHHLHAGFRAETKMSPDLAHFEKSLECKLLTDLHQIFFAVRIQIIWTCCTHFELFCWTCWFMDLVLKKSA